MKEAGNPTDPLKTGDTLFSKFSNYLESRNKVSKIAINTIIVTSIYALLSSVLPPQYVLWGWQAAISTVFLVALGLFAWHETIGYAQIMKPVYKLLYRLTGDDSFLKLTNDEVTK